MHLETIKEVSDNDDDDFSSDDLVNNKNNYTNNGSNLETKNVLNIFADQV